MPCWIYRLGLMIVRYLALSSMKVNLTESAINKISSNNPNSMDDSIAAILWTEPTYKETYVRNGEKTSMTFEKFSEGNWMLGWYERSDIPIQNIRKDKGIEFVFETVTAEKQVSEALIDFVGGRFTVSYDCSGT